MISRGYKPKRKTYTLKFEDPEMDGLVVRTRGRTVDDAIAFQAGLPYEEALERFADIVIDWNVLDEDDNPVPATAEGMRTLDEEFLVAVMGAFNQAINGVSGPLEKPSNDGEITEIEASMKMAPLSSSLAS